MHEASLVRNLLRQVDDVLDRHDAVRVTEITINVGPLSGVEPLLMQSAFDEMSIGTRSETAMLAIIEVPLVIRCIDCSHESRLQEMTFRCAECGSGSVRVTQGDCVELNTVSIEQLLPSN